MTDDKIAIGRVSRGGYGLGAVEPVASARSVVTDLPVLRALVAEEPAGLETHVVTIEAEYER